MTTKHQEIANELRLFFFDDMSPGSCFFLPHGAKIYNKLVKFIRKYYKVNGYDEVITPNIFDKELWIKSGHWEKYKQNMFLLTHKDDDGGDGEDEDSPEKAHQFAIKAMNCPSHCLMFNYMQITHKQLPLRLADFGVLHRNEFKGALRGLTRVRRFQQDDAHIFCSMDQIESEIKNILNFLHKFYIDIGFTYKLCLSTRPEEYIGDLVDWDKAEGILEKSLQEFTSEKVIINAGDGAFYGPKIDITIKDSLEREHQCATIQLDFNLPKRFKLEYLDLDGKTARPVIIHRAVLGSVERFMAILLEHTNGRLPFMFSPRQIAILPLTSEQNDYAHKVAEELYKYEVEIDSSNDDIRKKIKSAEVMKFNYILVVGKREAKDNTVAVRCQEFKQQVMSLEDFRRLL